MSFLTDEALTFHRFSEGSISIDGHRKLSMDNSIEQQQHRSVIPNTKGNESGVGGSTMVWTTGTTSSSHNGGSGVRTNLNGTSETNNEFQFISVKNNHKIQQNGSTIKLMEDQTSKQVIKRILN